MKDLLDLGFGITGVSTEGKTLVYTLGNGKGLKLRIEVSPFDGFKDDNVYELWDTRGEKEELIISFPADSGMSTFIARVKQKIA